MTTYITIPNADLAAERPITTGLMTKLRDNPLAVSEGDATAPSINPAALTIGGKGGDGIFDDATPAFSELGYYEFLGLNVLTVAFTLPVASIIRVAVPAAGTATLSDVLTVACRSRTLLTNAQQVIEARDFLGGFLGEDGGSAGFLGAGGGGVGAGGDAGAGLGGAGKSPAAMEKPWVGRRPFLGGNGGLTSGGGAGREWGPGGGSLILIVEGDLDATGGEINADGGHTDDLGAGSNSPGGGGGGSIIVICTGELTGGTFRARGGDAVLGGNGTGSSGGGGLVLLAAATLTGTQTLTVTAGAVQAPGVAGSAGYSAAITMTRDQLRTLLQRL